jgi:coenzyme PQQ precursor peptide PqqA
MPFGLPDLAVKGGGSMESQLAVWETPEFDEIGVAPEVTMYIAQLDE